jgi:hypothetical protein
MQPMFQDNTFQNTATTQPPVMNTFQSNQFYQQSETNSGMMSNSLVGNNSPMVASSSHQIFSNNPPSPQTSSFNFTDLTDFSPSYEYASSPPSFIPMNNGSSSEGIRILVQPKNYQIVNYNLYPAPELEFSTSYLEPITIQAFLVYKEDTIVDIPEGKNINENRRSTIYIHSSTRFYEW